MRYEFPIKIEPCPVCGKQPKFKTELSIGKEKTVESCVIYCKKNSFSTGCHHCVQATEYHTRLGGVGSAEKKAVEKWNADAEKIKKCIKVLRSFSLYEQGGTIYLPADREYTKKQLQSILRSGKDIEFI